MPTTGVNNTAVGASALANNTVAGGNVAVGYATLLHSTSGVDNVAIGRNALGAVTTGNDNIAIGASAGNLVTTCKNNIYIGYTGYDESNTIRIGGPQQQTFIAGIVSGSIDGGPVVVNSDGQLGQAGSSARFKDNVHDMQSDSAVVYALRPVSFVYKPDIDPQRTARFGLIAEEVEKVNPALVIHGQDGRPFSVRYDQINAMLLNEFLKEHEQVQAQAQTIQALAKRLDALESTAHPAGIPSDPTAAAPAWETVSVPPLSADLPAAP